VELISASAVEFHPGVTIGVTQVSRDAWGGSEPAGGSSAGSGEELLPGRSTGGERFLSGGDDSL